MNPDTTSIELSEGLSRLELFSDLSEKQLLGLSKLGEIISLESNAVLFREGDRGDRLYLILEGRLEVSSRSDGEVFFFKSGDVVGEIALLDGLPRTATVTALSPCRLFELSRRQFHEFLALDSKLAFNMMGLTNRKMRAALEREKALNANLRAKIDSITQLAAGVAHELNTPLNAITLGTEMALSVLLSKPQRAEKCLKTALKAAQTADSIISKLKYYSRETRMVNQKFALDQVVQDSLRHWDYQAEGIEIIKLASPEVIVRGDPQELQQVLSELLENSRDAILQGDYPKVIEIQVRNDGELAELLVADRGPGIDPEHVSRVFDPFFTTKAIGSGTGLGLSVSQKILEVHDGKLSLCQENGKTIFVMSLPKAT